jgi:hypothetical protein
MKNPAAENQMSLFAAPREKGAHEWSTFRTIKHDHAGAFRVLTPCIREVPRYPNIVHIRRYPRRLIPRHAV